ncbi:hypothetical protein COCSADRAFT_35305 [Bipolaris sorokiniana ND90Pr]|uniref:Uncharacterized protein n=1 Tax=Cochliobolus sativus (strain ND90Pr / ATCC 201652) TaxID=665912 RepID=M2RJD7_COCSN|nr:uncharacterized protein COCSADRAFT_35305 [Bipolaris sorokiniana ND90Pr]EMD66824.1 hypothetical protein COCSADRAFT_35305 [Bipolaris sorokiniana ND90Pr]
MSNNNVLPPGYKAWGPFIPDNYTIHPVSRSDIILASTAFGIANIFGLSAAFIGFRQTRASRQPWRNAYIWMIWLELAASVAIAVVCLLFLLRIIRPSFYMYMGILVCWVIQIQVLPQIIVNRIRVVLPDRQRGRHLAIGTAVVVTLINISVFCVWIPARLQISQRWIRINSIWDRIEKVLFLLLDAYLNWYFIKTVQSELVRNGLNKYNRLVRFNKRIIVVSLLFDVMIIAAMSIPNGFVYAIFHPLAYLAKLNIEMSMAHLIRTIALATPHNQNRMSFRASKSSIQTSPFTTDIFAEVPMPRRMLIRGLFSRNQHGMLQKDAQRRRSRYDSTQPSGAPDVDLQSLEPRSSKNDTPIAGDSVDNITCIEDTRQVLENAHTPQHVGVLDPEV